MRDIHYKGLLGLFICLFSAWLSAAVLPMEDANGHPLPSLAPLVEKVAPAVVSINIYRNGGDGALPKGRPVGLGSGVIVDAEQGLILSNHHVVAHADRIQVSLADGREFKARLIGSDPGVDLALLKIDASNLTALPLVDSDKLRVGDFVLAIGNPFGLGHSVSSGIVSALDRTGLGLENYENFIQIDAAINPGNSGGALVNLKGELVGINTAIVAPKGGNSVGIGFAIPSNVAKTISMHLARNGQVSRGSLGISVQNLSDQLKDALKVPRKDDGVIITEVSADSAAQKAGLQVGDVVTAINDRIVDSVENLRARLGLLTLNDTLKVDYLRNGKPGSVTAKIHNEKADKNQRIPIVRFAGMVLSDDHDKPGLRVRELQPKGPAADAGIMKNDIILSVNQHKVDTLEAFTKVVDAHHNLLLIQRGPGTLFLVLEAPQNG